MYIKLEGWEKPLPVWIVDAIIKGDITVHNAKGYQYLIGQAYNGHMLVVFK